MIDILKKAGERCDHYLSAHGVDARWSIHVHGFEFTANYGADKVRRGLYWSDIKDLDRDLKGIENAALKGLSS